MSFFKYGGVFFIGFHVGAMWCQLASPRCLLEPADLLARIPIADDSQSLLNMFDGGRVVDESEAVDDDDEDDDNGEADDDDQPIEMASPNVEDARRQQQPWRSLQADVVEEKQAEKMPAPAKPKASPPAKKSTPAAKKVLSEIKRGIIFTSQCSGSEWLADSLNSRDGVRWASEELIKYSKMNVDQWKKVAWSTYERQLEAVFADLEESLTAPADGKSPTTAELGVIGFKLMYDQIPPNLYAEFAKWLKEHHVHVIHLRRKCAALQFASHLQKLLRLDQGGKDHFSDKDDVKSFKTPRITFKEPRGPIAVHRLESNQQVFANYLRLYAAHVPVIEVAYEDLDGLHGSNWFNAILGFMGLDTAGRIESEYVKVGQRKCEDRLAGLGTNGLYEGISNLDSRLECLRMSYLEEDKLVKNATTLLLPTTPKQRRFLTPHADARGYMNWAKQEGFTLIQ